MRDKSTHITSTMLGLFLLMPCITNGSEKTDSLILNRIYEYHRQHASSAGKIQDNVYAKFRFNVEKRNPSLWLIPSMYSVARDPRKYLRESYSQVTFDKEHQFKIDKQVVAGTIRHNRRTMPTLLDYITPNIYDIALYDGHVLSPFNQVNRKFYKYTQRHYATGQTRLDFRPKLYNTQLLNGYAIVDTETGRIIKTILNGEFDMITFRTEISKESDAEHPLVPDRCVTAATFRFAGNRISTLFEVDYDCPDIPDSIGDLSDRELLDSIRPIPLSNEDRRIYEEYDLRHRPDTVPGDTLPQKKNLLKKIFWDTIGDNLVTPIAAESADAYVRLSPIINPLYLSYSHRHGLSYKINLRSRYTFSPHRYLTVNPTFGYNFKLRQFYFTAPIRMTYNPKRNGYAEIIWGNGNPISNSSVIEAVNENPDALKGKDMDLFDDTHLRVFNNIMIFPWLDIEGGLVYHYRKAKNKSTMHDFNMPVVYRSLAPMVGIKLLPWEKGPLVSIDWERGLRGHNHSDDNSWISYERWEADASWKIHKPGLRLLNLRCGAGFYSYKRQNYFVDYTNFRDRNLPEGWDDDWSGDFQLLNSSWYNASDYYVRGNVSYESPMLFATWLPYVGKYIEKERFYANTVLIQHTRPYVELGYGFTNRYLSVGAFASFLNCELEGMGCKFEIELFKRW